MAQEQVTAPIPGSIVSVEVTPGAKIAEGDTICILEAMKMQSPIVAPLGGTVTQISVEPGQFVQSEAPIATIEY